MIPGHAPLTIIFLDANVLVSAAWKEDSEIAQIWRMEGLRLVTSNYVMGEVQRNLHQITQIERLRCLMRSVQILSFERLPEIPHHFELPEKDRPVLAGAIQAQADLLLSGDKRHFGPLYGKTILGVRITAPTELLDVLRLRRS
ncbi:MAG: PIN domain-containing protein [Terracidiphilus sp.]|jgi:predicted nucleic acid-binding protein